MATGATSANASAGGLAVLGAASAGGVPEMGPGLVVGMPDAEIVDRLNAWGTARDGVVRDLADNLAQTSSVCLCHTFPSPREQGVSCMSSSA